MLIRFEGWGGVVPYGAYNRTEHNGCPNPGKEGNSNRISGCGTLLPGGIVDGELHLCYEVLNLTLSVRGNANVNCKRNFLVLDDEESVESGASQNNSDASEAGDGDG